MTEEEQLVRQIAMAAISEDMAERDMDDLDLTFRRAIAEHLEAARDRRRTAVRAYRDHVMGEAA